MTKVITISSGKGGVGKTVTAIALGAALNQFGKDVTVIDANLTTPNIGLYLGVPIVPITLHDVLKGKNHISEAVYLHNSGTKIVPSSISLQALQAINPDRLNSAVPGLTGLTDFVIIDSAAGLGREALAAIKVADEVLVVTNPELAAVTDALRTVKLAQELGKTVKGIVLTKTNAKNLDLSIANIESIIEKRVLGVIPEDRAVKFSVSKKDSVVHLYPQSASAVCYKKLAAELIGEKYEEKLPEPPKSEKSLMYHVLKFFGVID